MQHPSVYAQHAKELRAQITQAELKVLSLYSILAETEKLEREAFTRMKAALDAASEEDKKCAEKRFKSQIWPRHPGMDDEEWRKHVAAAMGSDDDELIKKLAGL